MAAEMLSRRALNRALLDRQMLLGRAPLPEGPDRAWRVIETIEHLGGLQAQAPFPPYYGLWSRLAGFRPDDLAELLLNRAVVRIALMRSTIHLVSARDAAMLRPLTQPVLDRALKTLFGKQLPSVDTAAIAVAGRVLVEEQPRTFSELGALLAESWPEHEPGTLATAVRILVPLVQVPPRAVWGRGGQALHTSAESWLGRPLDPQPLLTELVRRYLAAFGPATVADIQVWSGLTRLREPVQALRDELRTFRDEDGRELFDLPGAPRPDPGTPAPVRLAAEFDNIVLSHADRTRIISDADRGRMFTRNGIFPGTVLIDGFVAGMWRITRARDAVTLVVEMFRDPVSARDRDAIVAEGLRMLAFTAPGAAADVRFGALVS
jgi:Winged helix DNA-binding domain